MDNQLFTRRRQSLAVIANNQELLLEGLMRDDWSSFVDKNVVNDRFYLAGTAIQGFGASAVVPNDNQLYLVPFISPVRARLTELGVCKATGSSSTPIRLGLYQATSQNNLLPSALLAQASMDTTAAAFYSFNTGITVEAGILYYAAFVRQAGAGLSFAMASTFIRPFWGYARPAATINNPPASFIKTGVTGALPNPFDVVTTGAASTSNPMMMLRFTNV